MIPMMAMVKIASTKLKPRTPRAGRRESRVENGGFIVSDVYEVLISIIITPGRLIQETITFVLRSQH
jgi:hypothetical protein